MAEAVAKRAKALEGVKKGDLVATERAGESEVLFGWATWVGDGRSGDPSCRVMMRRPYSYDASFWIDSGREVLRRGSDPGRVARLATAEERAVFEALYGGAERSGVVHG